MRPYGSSLGLLVLLLVLFLSFSTGYMWPTKSQFPMFKRALAANAMKARAINKKHLDKAHEKNIHKVREALEKLEEEREIKQRRSEKNADNLGSIWTGVKNIVTKTRRDALAGHLNAWTVEKKNVGKSGQNIIHKVRAALEKLGEQKQVKERNAETSIGDRQGSKWTGMKSAFTMTRRQASAEHRRNVKNTETKREPGKAIHLGMMSRAIRNHMSFLGTAHAKRSGDHQYPAGHSQHGAHSFSLRKVLPIVHKLANYKKRSSSVAEDEAHKVKKSLESALADAGKEINEHASYAKVNKKRSGGHWKIKKSLESALADAGNEINEHADDAELHHKRSESHSKNRKSLESALADAGEDINEHADDAELHHKRSESHSKNRKSLESALADAGKEINEHADDAELHHKRSESHSKNRKSLESALADAGKEINEHADDAELHHRRSESHSKSRKSLESALADAGKEINEHADDAELHHKRSESHYKSRKSLESALADAGKEINEHASDFQVQHKRAENHLHKIKKSVMSALSEAGHEISEQGGMRLKEKRSDVHDTKKSRKRSQAAPEAFSKRSGESAKVQ